MVARRQAARSDATSWLAVPRPQRHGSGLGSPVAPRRAVSGRARRDPQAGKPAYTAPLVCHTPARARRRYPGHPGAAGTREHQHDRHLYPGLEQDDAGGGQPARPDRGRDGRQGTFRLSRCVGSCTGGFRTQAPETLHRSGHFVAQP